jgi:hypothetical protein
MTTFAPSAAGRLQFFGAHAGLDNPRTCNRHLAQVRRKAWVVYAKPPFSGPEAVLAYLSRYTHRVAISNRRLISFDKAGVAFRYKDYRQSGSERYRVTTLHADEFVRRFLLHVLPTGFHRIRHYGLLASAGRKANVAAAHGSRSRGEGTMTRHGLLQPTDEATLLRRSNHRACRSRETWIAAVMTPRRPRLLARHHAIDAFKARLRSSTSRLSPRSQIPRSSCTGTGFPKTP